MPPRSASASVEGEPLADLVGLPGGAVRSRLAVCFLAVLLGPCRVLGLFVGFAMFVG